MNGPSARLYRENMIILMVMQAVSGALTSNVKGLTIEFSDDGGITAHFLMRCESPEDVEEITEDFPTEVSVFTMGVPEIGDIAVRPIIELTSEHPEGYVPPGRCVFLFRG